MTTADGRQMTYAEIADEMAEAHARAERMQRITERAARRQSDREWAAYSRATRAMASA